MNLRGGLDKLKFDVRMVELNVRTRTITEKEVAQNLANLPDQAGNSENFSVDVDSDDMQDALDNQ